MLLCWLYRESGDDEDEAKALQSLRSVRIIVYLIRSQGVIKVKVLDRSELESDKMIIRGQ